MTSLILYTATRYLRPLLLVFSIFLLLHGHNKPGGGFIGGLVAAAAFTLHAIAYGVVSARDMLRVDPPLFIGLGLLLASGSGIWALVMEQPFLTGQWAKATVLGLGMVELGTPLLFDLGVYLVVVGVTVLIILSLAEG